MTRILSNTVIRARPLAVLVASACLFAPLPLSAQQDPREWLHRVRIGAYGLSSENALSIVQQAEASGVYGIEVDNDIPGRYESLGMPQEKLEAIRRVAAAAHRANNKAFVYVAGFECISAHVDGPHTLAKEHPEWLQRKLSGEPAVFDTKAAFWIAPGEEDAWISPYAADWRKLYMQRMRQIAATGIDGIYVDIPYWMTHFTGWEDSWASFDDSTVAEFRKRTGLDARKNVRLGDYADLGFQRWIDFRIKTITEFLGELRSNAISINPSIAVIAEIYPGIEAEAPRVGADVYQLYPQVDAIAHEYEFGESEDHTAASRTQLDWFLYQVGIRSFRAFAGDKPTWILNYSWDGAAKVQPRDAMLNLAMSELMAGANLWDARGHVMSGSNDMATRSEVYRWVAAHEDIFAAHREPVGDIGVYFSDTSRNLDPAGFVASYRGVILLLLRNHIQFRIVTPRTIGSFDGTVLALPSVGSVSDSESAVIHKFAQAKGSVVITGHADAKLSDLTNTIRFLDAPERTYLKRAEADFNAADPATPAALLSALHPSHLLHPSHPSPSSSPLEVVASGNVVAHVATIGKRTYVFLANFDGLKGGEVARPRTAHAIQITTHGRADATLHVLPFLGKELVITGESDGAGVRFTLPDFDRGAVAWVD